MNARGAITSGILCCALVACGAVPAPSATATSTAHPTAAPQATITRILPSLPPMPPAPLVGTPLERGRQAFALHCSACHGGNGQGYASLIPPINTAQFLSSRTDDQLRQVIADGLADKGMPPSKGRLSSQDIDDIVLFMRSWQK